MSFTAAYSQLEALDTDEAERLDRPPRITDWEGLVEWPETRGDLGTDTFRDMMVTDEWTDHDAYPEETWKVLKGFKSWKPSDAFGLDFDPDIEAILSEIEGHEDYSTGPLGYGYNMERIGIPYDGEDGFWKVLFKGVSEFTEPFAFYHSPYEHEFPDVTNFRDGAETVYYVECANGQMYAEEQTFRRTNTESIIEEVGRVADHEFTYPE